MRKGAALSILPLVERNAKDRQWSPIRFLKARRDGLTGEYHHFGA